MHNEVQSAVKIPSQQGKSETPVSVKQTVKIRVWESPTAPVVKIKNGLSLSSHTPSTASGKPAIIRRPTHLSVSKGKPIPSQNSVNDHLESNIDIDSKLYHKNIQKSQ